MNKPEWTETKKECSVDSEGKLKIEKITFEKNKKEFLPAHKKDLIDLVIRSVGALSIFIPLLLLYFQRQNEINREQSKNATELFTSVATDMQILINSGFDNKEFLSAYDNILFKYSPKIRLLKDDSLIQIYSYISAFAKNIQYIKKIISLKDSAVSQSNKAYYSDVILDRNIPLNGAYQRADLIHLKIPKDSVIVRVRKSHEYCYYIHTAGTAYKDFLEKNKIPQISDSITSYIADSLTNLAFEAQNELLAFEDYLTDSTGWFNKEYLDKHTTGATIFSLNISSKKLIKILDANAEKMESYRGLLEKRLLQLL